MVRSQLPYRLPITQSFKVKLFQGPQAEALIRDIRQQFPAPNSRIDIELFVHDNGAIWGFHKGFVVKMDSQRDQVVVSAAEEYYLLR